MEGIRPGLIIAGWLIMLASAIGNGAIGQLVIRPRHGEYAGHVYKSVVGIIVTIVVSWVYAVWTAGPGWNKAAWVAGLSWLALTVGFEFIFGHYVMGQAWERIIADYRFWKGRLWALLLVVLLFAPVVVGGMVNGG